MSMTCSESGRVITVESGVTTSVEYIDIVIDDHAVEAIKRQVEHRTIERRAADQATER